MNRPAPELESRRGQNATMIARTGSQALRILGPVSGNRSAATDIPGRVSPGDKSCALRRGLTPGQNNHGLRRSLGEERPLSPARQVS